MSEIECGIGMEIWKIVFHSNLEIFHSILASSIFHAKIYVPFHTMPCYQITHLFIGSVKHHISSLSSVCISRLLSCLVCVFLVFFLCCGLFWCQTRTVLLPTSESNFLTRILPLYVMIVKVRQNFKKRREFSWIRGQKKFLPKIFIVYEI